MRGRSFLILLVLALGLGAYAYFVELPRDPAAETETKEKVIGADSSTFEELQITSATGEVTTLKKVNNIWEITAPEPLKADSSEVGSLLTTLESLEAQRVISEKPASFQPYGLEPPKFSVSVKTAGGAAPKVVHFGEKTPTGADLYARVAGDPRLIVVSGYLEDSLNKSTFGLRDKAALQFERDLVDAVSIDVTGSPALAFAKRGDAWRFTRPYDASADAASIDGMIGRLATARMSAIESKDGTADLKKFGLDKPQGTVTIGAGSTAARIAFGAKKDDTTIYARDLSRPLVFTVESALLEEFKKKPEDLRRKDIFEFRAFSALDAAITAGGQSFEFAKTKGQKPADPNAPVPDVWKLTKPEVKDVDQTKATDLLTALAGLRAESFSDKPLTTGESFVVRVKYGDDPSTAKTEEVRFMKSGAVVHAMVAGEGGAAVVSASEFDRAIALAKELAGVK